MRKLRLFLFLALTSVAFSACSPAGITGTDTECNPEIEDCVKPTGNTVKPTGNT